MKDARKIQNDYYSETSGKYDEYHVSGNDPEHDISLFFLSSIIEMQNCSSILDVGAGTGRSMSFLNKKHTDLNVCGIEPVDSLREIAYSKGISPEKLNRGDGNSIGYADHSFDIVCEFGVLHHIENPRKMISEMLRVSKMGIFISDSNNFGQGNRTSRILKGTLNVFGLWPLFNYVRTRGAKYQISKTDGLFYSYSVFNDYLFLQDQCEDIYCFNLYGKHGVNPYSSSPHVAIFAKKKNN